LQTGTFRFKTKVEKKAVTPGLLRSIVHSDSSLGSPEGNKGSASSAITAPCINHADVLPPVAGQFGQLRSTLFQIGKRVNFELPYDGPAALSLGVSFWLSDEKGRPKTQDRTHQ
jgi:hypothetical protein